MRRFLAIAATACLLFSVAEPVWATACASMGKTPMCHRVAAHHQHHCESMGEQDDENTSPDSQTLISAISSDCPMHCCGQAQIGNGTAILIVLSWPQLAVFEYCVDFPAITFTTSGFSSHTDRGPPLA